jgi:hypothetical protein
MLWCVKSGFDQGKSACLSFGHRKSLELSMGFGDSKEVLAEAEKR